MTSRYLHIEYRVLPERKKIPEEEHAETEEAGEEREDKGGGARTHTCLPRFWITVPDSTTDTAKCTRPFPLCTSAVYLLCIYNGQ